MKKLIIIIILLANASIIAKEYSLEELLINAVNNSNYIKQNSNYSQIEKYEVSDIWSNYYPQFSIEGQASYQSDIFRIPLSIPNMPLPDLRKDQYNIALNLTQLIWDGGLTTDRINISKLSTKANTENSNSKIRNIVENTSNLYFGAKLVHSKIRAILSVINTLENNQKQIQSLVSNGVLLQSNLDMLEIQLATKKQNYQSLVDDYKAILKKLSIITSQQDIDSVGSIALETQFTNQEIMRNEINMMNYYKQINNIKSDMNYSMLYPKISAFARLGYSNPNQLNMFEQNWSDYYMFGLRFSWKPFNWFSESRNSELIKMQNDNIDLEINEFKKNINLQLEQERSEIEKAEMLINQDKLIIKLQSNICDEKYSQFLNGTATISEYLNEINSKQIYEINLGAHEIMLENSKINLLIKSGQYQGVNK